VINKHDRQNIIIGYNNLFSSASRVIGDQNDQRFESHSNIKRLTARKQNTVKCLSVSIYMNKNNCMLSSKLFIGTCGYIF